MEKKLQLMGISTLPSGRLAEDGACLESMNVRLEAGELTPAYAPTDAGEDYGLPEGGVYGDIIYVHRNLPEYANVIVHRENQYGHAISAYCGGDTPLILGTLPFLPESVTSVGNILSLSSGEGVRHFMFKDGAYKDLGGGPPIPDIAFVPQYMDMTDYDTWSALTQQQRRFTALGSRDFRENADVEVDGQALHLLGKIPTVTLEDATEAEMEDAAENLANEYGRLRNWTVNTKGEVKNARLASMVDTAWAQLEAMVNENAMRGILNFPVFARACVRLYDGTLYGVNIPVLLSPAYDPDGKWASVSLRSRLHNIYTQDYRAQYNVAARYQVHCAYKVRFSSPSGFSWGDWEDMVEAVEIYVSNQVIPFPDKKRITLTDVSQETSEWFEIFVGTMNLDPYGLSDEGEQRRNIESYDQFRLVRSYTLEEFAALSDDAWHDLQDDMNMDPDLLAVQTRMEDSYQTVHSLNGYASYAHNGRLLAYNASQTLSKGMLRPHGPGLLYSFYDPQDASTWRLWPHTAESVAYRLCYHIDTGEGVERRVVTGTLGMQGMAWHSWIAYPDSRCTKVDMEVTYQGGIPTIRTVKMRAHPTLDMAYAFLGFGADGYIGTSVGEPGPQSLPEPDDTEYMRGTVMQSEFGNPFVFPAGGRIKVGEGDIIALAVASRPLSLGQRGNYLYVFTSTGIWALQSNSEGTFTNSGSVSGDVAYAGSVTALEQSVAFLSARGAMLLSGNDVQCLSDPMRGRWYPGEVLEGLLAFAEEGSALADRILLSSADIDTFPLFMSEARPVYDPKGRRMLYLRPGSRVMWVYSLDSSSWSRLNASSVCGVPLRAVNGYPDCLVACRRTEGRDELFDFSRFPGGEGAVPLPGLVITRELALDAPDVRKSVTRLIVRKEGEAHSVKWLLMASDDGVTWKVLHSLRGPGHNWFRIALLVDLDADLHLPYIGLEYEPRYTDKAR